TRLDGAIQRIFVSCFRIWLSRTCNGKDPGNTDPRVLEKQELQQPTYVALSYINRFMTDAARREQESLKKKIQPKLSLTLSSSVSRGNVSTPPRHSSGSLTPPVTPPITPSSSFRSSTPTGYRISQESSAHCPSVCTSVTFVSVAVSSLLLAPFCSYESQIGNSSSPRLDFRFLVGRA
ncbi:hypothetical protein H8959_008283, partial [Pygathrix nigripes]